MCYYAFRVTVITVSPRLVGDAVVGVSSQRDRLRVDDSSVPSGLVVGAGMFLAVSWSNIS